MEGGLHMRHFWPVPKPAELLPPTALPATAQSRLGKGEETDGAVRAGLSR